MIVALRRGLIAGLVAGALSGLFGLAVGSPAIDTLEAVSHNDDTGALGDDHHDDASAVARTTQRAGLVVGAMLTGAAVGVLFGVAFAWSTGRIHGDPWVRSLRLGAVMVASLVLLPALASPPMPPGTDPDTLSTRTLVHLSTCAFALSLAVAGRLISLRLTEMQRPHRQTLVMAAVVASATAWLLLVPSDGLKGMDVPASLVWDYRLRALGTQAILYGGVPLVFGLLAHRAGASSQTRPPVQQQVPLTNRD